MPNKEWYNYFRQKSIEESKLFEENEGIDIGKEFDRLYKIVVRQYGGLDLDLKLEKLTYQFVTGQKQRITARNTELFERKYTAERMRNFANKYEPIKEYLNWYMQGEITLGELEELVDDFKNIDRRYLTSGSG